MGRLIASKRRTKRHLHLLCPSRGSANAHGDSPSPNSKRDEAVDAGRRLVSNPGGFPLARRAVHPNIPLLYVSTLHLPPHPSRIRLITTTTTTTPDPTSPDPAAVQPPETRRGYRLLFLRNVTSAILSRRAPLDRFQP
ncbi:hypothetical protein KC359_g160 [Hortaea werneckii]|nr:hypothetical protein KC359_g160 [Hortaea werneckii]